jgi:transcriptional regulator with XRE-family HTH domain
MPYYLSGMNTNNGNFGYVLAELRKAKGFTQQELADSIGSSQRMIAYYERHAKRPPLEKLQAVAQALSVTIDQLLGVQRVTKQRGAPKDAYLRRKLQQVHGLPKTDQKMVVGMIDALATKNQLQKKSS